MIEIITTFDEVVPYLNDVTALANAQRKELGFIPSSAYKESCFKGNLFVATIITEQEKKLFAGYALLGGIFPAKRIFQLAVFSQYRSRGVGKSLVDMIVQDADKKGFYRIAIKVGEKLSANAFWNKSLFALEKTIPGRLLHPLVNVRIREIRPSLFSPALQPQPALRAMADTILSKATLYLLDTNILLDISKELPESNISRNLLRLVNEGDIEVAISQEAVKELEKHCLQGEDPALKIANSLPILTLDNEKNLLTHLREVVFSSEKNIQSRDASDIKHIATAIFNNAKGFITRDEFILRQHEVLWNQFSLEILSPVDFWVEDELSRLDTVTLDSVARRENFAILTMQDSERERIRKIFPGYEIDERKFDYAFLKVNEKIAAYCAVEKRLPRGGRAKVATLFLLDNPSKANALIMLDYISMKSLPDSKEIAINLSVLGDSGQMADVLMERGYHKTEDGTYGKICAGPVIGKKNWNNKKEAIKRLSSISLPATLPDYRSFDQKVPLEQEREVPLWALEDFLSAILVLPSRDGSIIPIRKEYADELFAHAPQRSLLPPLVARLSEHKSYFGDYRVASRLRPGKLLFFYQSQTQYEPGQVIAFARIVRSNIASKDKTNAMEESRRRGVLGDTALNDLGRSDKMLETVFTHSVVFPKPVMLKRLREIGCNDKANFVTAFNITHQQVCTLLKEGGIL